ncbi:lipoprotein [Spiroplasma ixodetis]|uniref:lipoprotein n=1 Tax=Spiroplasma ixodetis TaxID=2141 RepID=UPI0025765B70|nr:lipoprotein [Spiroplasma ixodetis]WJG69922.1 hypothetical protein SIXOD_v1c09120 [Spiroplasma ixodetis Y32]
MRKILSLLGAMILTTTTSASVIACGGENEKSMVSHKNNLNKFELPVLYLRAEINNKYNELNGEIIHQNFGVSLKDGYEIKYYSDEQGKGQWKLQMIIKVQVLSILLLQRLTMTLFEKEQLIYLIENLLNISKILVKM